MLPGFSPAANGATCYWVTLQVLSCERCCSSAIKTTRRSMRPVRFSAERAWQACRRPFGSIVCKFGHINSH